MSKLAIVLGMVVAMVSFTHAAPTVVNYNTAKLTWEHPNPEVVTFTTVKCGHTLGVWDYTRDTEQTEMMVSEILPGPGSWVCVVTASNPAGESEESSSVPFAAVVGAPLPPVNLTVVPS